MSRYMLNEILNTSCSPDWDAVNSFLLTCGSSHDPNKFAASIISGAGDLFAFDRALVFFIDSNGKVIDEHLHNFSQFHLQEYLNMYGYKPESAYSLVRDYREQPDRVELVLIDWQDEPLTEFIRDYVRPQGLAYSLAMVFYDLYGKYRTVISIDLFSGKAFSRKGLTNLYSAMPHLSNLHKNFFYNANRKSFGAMSFSSDNSALTKREAEIANLLCQGVSPANISQSLYISKATTYKHIANIYEKLNISSQRELLALMLSQ